MAKINKTEIYTLIPQPELLDYLIGTKKGNKATHNFPIEAIIQLINSTNGINNIQYQFSDGTDPLINYTTDGKLFTNTNNGNANGFSQLIFSKNTLYPIDLSLLFIKLGATQNIVLTLQNPENPNNFMKLKLVSFTNNTSHFIFGVQPYENLIIGNFINENIYSLYFDIVVSSEADRFTQLGTTNLVNNNLIISSGYAWLINGSNYANTTPFNFIIPLSTIGNQRIDLFVVDRFNNILKIQGVESVGNPVKPNVPQNTLELTFVLVNETEILDPVLPIFGETFVEKIEKKETYVNTNNIFNVNSKVANFLFGNNVSQCSGFNFTDNSLYYEGKKYSFKNSKTTNLILKNRNIVNGNVRFSFSDNNDYILKPGEIAEFILRNRKFLFLEYIGKIQETSIKQYKYIFVNTILDNSFHEATVYVQASLNITIPTGLRTDFNCTFRTFTGAIATFLISGTVLNSQSTGDVLEASSMCYLSIFSPNNYLLTGGNLS